MQVKTIDCETSIKCPLGNNKAHPMWLANKVVSVGIKPLDGKYTDKHIANNSILTPEGKLFSCHSDEDMLVGQNIKFDLMYGYRKFFDNAKLPYIWDTQLAEYILTGQESKYASLDELTIKYVGDDAVKDDKIKAYWDDGVDTENIPKEELLSYQKGDVYNTEKVFKAQYEAAKESGQLSFIYTQMDALRATTAMALNGMAVDWEYVTNKRNKLAFEIEYCEKQLYDIAPELDWKSPKQLSLYFFGGEEKYKDWEEVGFYKNGNVKKKRVEKVRKIEGKVDGVLVGSLLGKLGYYTTDDDVLQQISLIPWADENASNVAELVMSLRKLSKYKETYYENLLSLRFLDGFIYPQINHCATATGRLSCTQPNLQNQTTDGGIKAAYISRYGANGRILELDYSQLEVVWLAYLTQDEQLIEDINNGVDVHTALYEDMYGRTPSSTERKAFKPRTFQLIYGAGAGAISKQANISLAEAKEFIRVFYNRYKGVKEYHTSIVDKANKEKVVYYKDGVPGPFYKYVHKMPWGRHYVFHSYDNDWSSERTLSPTQLKNYTVQGSATGDMVPLVLGQLQRALETSEWAKKAHLVMTVHDSIVLDTHEDVLYNVAKLAKDVMESAPELVKKYFNIDFPCPLKVEAEAGINWMDKEEVKL